MTTKFNRKTFVSSLAAGTAALALATGALAQSQQQASNQQQQQATQQQTQQGKGAQEQMRGQQAEQLPTALRGQANMVTSGRGEEVPDSAVVVMVPQGMVDPGFHDPHSRMTVSEEPYAKMTRGYEGVVVVPAPQGAVTGARPLPDEFRDPQGRRQMVLRQLAQQQQQQQAEEQMMRQRPPEMERGRWEQRNQFADRVPRSQFLGQQAQPGLSPAEQQYMQWRAGQLAQADREYSQWRQDFARQLDQRFMQQQQQAQAPDTLYVDPRTGIVVDPDAAYIGPRGNVLVDPTPLR